MQSTHDKTIKLEMGRRIREQRKLSGFKPKQIYTHLHLARTTYTGYEMGTRTPDPGTLIKLAELFNTSVSYLMCETNNSISNSSIIELEKLLKAGNLTFKGEILTEKQLKSIYDHLSKQS